MPTTLLEEAAARDEAWRQTFYTLHQAPELGGREERTAVFIRRRLTELGIPYAPSAGTGTVAILQGGKPGKTLAFRADMDALPIQEASGLSYASQIPGVMHACGHDFHITALLGAAELLRRRRAELRGAVRLLFQPDEEGDGGADRMVGEGALEGVDLALCCHVDSALPTGTLSTRPGPVCAASNPFTVTLRGRGSHGAKPHLGADVIVAGAQMISALQTIASRRTAPTDPVVASVGSFHAGEAGNVLPETARFSGVLRTMTPAVRERAKAELRSIVAGTAAAMGVEAEVEITEGYPCCHNDPEATALAWGAGEKILGRENLIPQEAPSLGTDDFGYISAKVPGCYYYIGVGGPGGGYPNHSPRFTADPAALYLAAAVEAQAAVDYLC